MLFGVSLIAAAIAARLALAVRRSRPSAAAVLVALALAALGLGATDLPSLYTLRKTVGLLLMPVGLLWLSILIAAAAAVETRRRRLAAGLATVALALGLAGSPVVGGWLVGRLERPFEAVDPMREGPYEAVFVLGGGAIRDRAGRISLDDAADRIVLPVRLVLAGRAERLVASGPWVRAADGSRWSYPQEVADFWVELGVPADRIVLLEGPTSTSEEAEAAASLVAATGWSRLGLVTSAYHMDRSLANFRRHGLDPAPLPCDFRGPSTVPDLRSLVPQARGFETVQLAVWELLGSLAGR